MAGEYFHEWTLLTARNLHSLAFNLEQIEVNRDPGNGNLIGSSLLYVVEVRVRGDLTAATLT
jgi:hypothetical protein